MHGKRNSRPIEEGSTQKKKTSALKLKLLRRGRIVKAIDERGEEGKEEGNLFKNTKNGLRKCQRTGSEKLFPGRYLIG